MLKFLIFFHSRSLCVFFLFSSIARCFHCVCHWNERVSFHTHTNTPFIRNDNTLQHFSRFFSFICAFAFISLDFSNFNARGFNLSLSVFNVHVSCCSKKNKKKHTQRNESFHWSMSANTIDIWYSSVRVCLFEHFSIEFSWLIYDKWWSLFWLC